MMTTMVSAAMMTTAEMRAVTMETDRMEAEVSTRMTEVMVAEMRMMAMTREVSMMLAMMATATMMSVMLVMMLTGSRRHGGDRLAIFLAMITTGAASRYRVAEA